MNKTYLNVVCTLITTGILALVSVSLKTSQQIEIVKTDIKYIKDYYKKTELRLSKLEDYSFTHKDSEYLKNLVNLQLKELEKTVDYNKKNIKKLFKKLDEG